MLPARVAALLAVLTLLSAPVLAASAGPASVGTPKVEKWAGGLKMPVDIEWGKDGYLYAAELAAGDVVRLKDGKVVGEKLLHVDVSFGGERGLAGMTLDPQKKGRIWVYYTVAGGTMDDGPEWRGTNRLSWFEGGAEHKVLDVGAGLMHNGGRLAFAPDGGSLYVTVGDSGERANTQDLAKVEGKLLRIDREGNGVDGNHRDRIVSWGHRNMYGLALAPDGTILMTENMNGQNDEVNIVEVGKDYGWPECEGDRKTDTKEPCAYDHTGPIAQFEATVAPTGAAWVGGSFFWGAFNKGDVHRVWFDGSAWQDEVVYHHGETPRILDVTAGPEGNTVYFSVWTVNTENPDASEGQIWRLTFDALAGQQPNVRGLGEAEPPASNGGGGGPVAPPASWRPDVPLAGLLAAGALAAGGLLARRRA